jgi:hypothetical protein
MRASKEQAKMRYTLGALIFGALLCVGPMSVAFAQLSVNAGDVSAAPGTTAIVPISIALPAGMPAATLQFNLTVVANGGAPAIASDVKFESVVGPPTLTLNHGPGTVLVGWLSSLSPVLTGTTQIGTLSVPIPAGASSGQTYTVQVIKPSGTSDGSVDLGKIASANGTITISGK